MSRIAVAATAPFGADVLERLAAKHEVAALLTRPDAPAGRGRRLAAPPAKVVAEGLGIPVRYVDVPPDEFRARLAAAGTPEGMIGTLDEVFAERRRCPVSRVDLTTHVKFRVAPTRFVEFARRMRAAFR